MEKKCADELAKESIWWSICDSDHPPWPNYASLLRTTYQETWQRQWDTADFLDIFVIQLSRKPEW